MNYYKILNEKENHHGMQYKEGLNTDIMEFNPSGNCTPGGIYFSREDILDFLRYGQYVRKVTLPENEPVYQNPGDCPIKWKAHKVILGKRRDLNTKTIKSLINEGANIKRYLFNWCIKNDLPGLLAFIIHDFNKYKINAGLDLAVSCRKIKCVKVLLPLSHKKYRIKITEWHNMNKKDCKLSKNMLKLFEPYIKKKKS